MTVLTEDAIDPALEPQSAAPPARSRTRPFYWSVRRELWENPSIYMAPLITAGVILLGTLISVLHPPRLMHTVREGGVVTHAPFVIPAAAPYFFAGIVIIVIGLIVGVFYCLGALHNERRDRSILFWKSLPVSDLTTVLAKASIPMVVLPLVTFAVIVGAQLVMFGLTGAVQLVHGPSGALWSPPPLLQIWGLLLYGLVANAIWQSTLWGWLLMVSAWAKRTAFLWAFGPPVAVCIVERVAFGTTYAWSVLQDRLSGGAAAAFLHGPQGQGDDLPIPDPMQYLSSPGLWVGLVFAAAFFAAAVWLRRRREPI